MSARRSLSSVIVPQSSTTAFTHNRIYIDGGEQAPLLPCELCQKLTANDFITLYIRLRFARSDGKSMKQVGPANDSHEELATHNGHPLDLMLLHQVHDLFNRSILGHRDRVSRHDFHNFAAVGVCVFIREPARSNKKFKPSRSQTLRSGFDASKKIAFGDHAYKVALLVNHWQPADPVLEHDLRGLHNRGIDFDRDNRRRHYFFSLHSAPPIRPETHSKTMVTISPMPSSTPAQRKADAKLAI